MGKWRKPSKVTTVEPTWRGIFVTCNRGRESQCAREARELFEGVAESLYGGQPEERSEETSGSIEDDIQKEIDELKSTKRKHVVVHDKLGVECVVFVQTRYPVDPAALTLEVCSLVHKREMTARYIQRLAPVQKFVKCDAELGSVGDLSSVLAAHLRENSKFAIRPTLRLSPVTRDKVIPAIARLVGPGHSVDLKNFDQIILVEGFKGVLGLSVLSASAELTQKYCRFNLVQITAENAKSEVEDS